MRSSRSALVLLLAAGTGFAANVALPDCIPPDAKIVFGVSLRSLLDSPVLKSFQSDMQKMSADLMRGGPGGPLPVLETIKSGPLSGFDPLKDVDDLIITSSAQNDKATGLIAMHGRFDPKRFPGASTSYNGVLIFGGEKKGADAIALLDESTAVMGDLAQVRGAIDGRDHPSGVKPALAERVRVMSGRFDFWGVGDMPAGYRPSAGAAEEFDSVDHFEFGASLHKALEITGSIHARTPKDADKMAESMKLIEAMLKGKPSSANGTKIDLDSANGTIKLSIVISEEDLKKGIEAQKSSLTTAMNSRKPPAKLVAPPQIVKDSHGDTVNVILPGGH